MKQSCLLHLLYENIFISILTYNFYCLGSLKFGHNTFIQAFAYYYHRILLIFITIDLKLSYFRANAYYFYFSQLFYFQCLISSHFSFLTYFFEFENSYT